MHLNHLDIIFNYNHQIIYLHFDNMNHISFYFLFNLCFSTVFKYSLYFILILKNQSNFFIIYLLILNHFLLNDFHYFILILSNF